MSRPSTELSRRLTVDATYTLRSFSAHLADGDVHWFAVDPPRVLTAGKYRVDLDLKTHTATITEEAST